VAGLKRQVLLVITAILPNCQAGRQLFRCEKDVSLSELVDYLKTRRSSLAMNLVEPAPDAAEIETLIEIASRVPDHKKLQPWRFVEYGFADRKKLSKIFLSMSDEDAASSTAEKRQVEITRFCTAPLVIGVIHKNCDNPAVSEFEQVLSVGAAAMLMLVACNAMGYEAQWLTGWFGKSRKARMLLGLKDNEQIAGLVHIGTNHIAKAERTRPELSEIYSKFEL